MDIGSLVDYLEIGCPCCQLEYNVWFLTGLPPPPHRHALADPKAALHRELMQCQFCFKSRREGVTFFRCAGCQIEIYCVSLSSRSLLPSRLPSISRDAEQTVSEASMEKTQG